MALGEQGSSLMFRTSRPFWRGRSGVWGRETDGKEQVNGILLIYYYGTRNAPSRKSRSKYTFLLVLLLTRMGMAYLLDVEYTNRVILCVQPVLWHYPTIETTL